ncbi:MAG: hypothetical protein ACKVOB_04040 [Sphingomonas sp.]
MRARRDDILLVRQRAYVTSPDRVGMALGAGTLLAGLLSILLLVPGAGAPGLGVLMALVAGGLAAAGSIVLLAGPLWWLCHRRGWRRAGHAATLGALVTVALLLVAQRQGLVDASASAAILALRWTSAIATSLFWALPSAIIGAVMWRIAYRRAR